MGRGDLLRQLILDQRVYRAMIKKADAIKDILSDGSGEIRLGHACTFGVLSVSGVVIFS